MAKQGRPRRTVNMTSYPAEVHAEVLVRDMAGDAKSVIAEDLHLAKETVALMVDQDPALYAAALAEQRKRHQAKWGQVLHRSLNRLEEKLGPGCKDSAVDLAKIASTAQDKFLTLGGQASSIAETRSVTVTVDLADPESRAARLRELAGRFAALALPAEAVPGALGVDEVVDAEATE